MKSFKYIIKDELGIHARPAGLLVREAKKFKSKALIEVGEKSAELSKLMALLGLAIKQGNEVTVTVEGEDEAAEVTALETLFKVNL